MRPDEYSDEFKSEFSTNPDVECGSASLTAHDVPKRLFSISTLSLSQSWDTTDNLLSAILSTPLANLLLKLTGNYWPSKDSKETCVIKILHKIYFLLNRASFVTLIYFGFILIINGINSRIPLTAILGFTIVADAISVIPAQYSNQLRLQRKLTVQDSFVISETAKAAAWFGLVYCISIILALSGGIELYLQKETLLESLFFLQVGEFSVSCYLTLNMFMLLLDLNLSSIQLDRLSHLAESKELTLSIFNTTRLDIHTRRRQSSVVTDVIIIPCILSATTILAIMYTGDIVNSIGVKVGTMGIVSWIAMLTKELLFVIVAFIRVASLNSQADSISKVLVMGMWSRGDRGGRSSGIGIGGSGSGSGGSGGGSGGGGSGGYSEAESERIAVVVSAIVDPISFKLVMRRINWTIVSSGLLGFGLGAVGLAIKLTLIQSV